jgi:acyl-coenzyme A thioesterase PaaI-like protein
MLKWIQDDWTDEDRDMIEGPAEALAASVRELIDATVRSEVDADELNAVRDVVDEAVRRLRVKQLPGSFGNRYGMSGALRAWGNAVRGLRNAIAPPLDIVWLGDGTVVGTATLGAAYEGPPTFAHGGVAGLLLDQVMGEAAHAAERPGMTARLTLNYRTPTPLGQPLRVEAKAQPPVPGEEHKTVVLGTLYAIEDDGTARVCVEADGIFILPRQVRERIAHETAQEGS